MEEEVKDGSLAAVFHNGNQGTQESGLGEREKAMSFGHVECKVPFKCSQETITQTTGYMRPELSGQKNVGVFSVLVKWSPNLPSWVKLPRYGGRECMMRCLVWRSHEIGFFLSCTDDPSFLG